MKGLVLHTFYISSEKEHYAAGFLLVLFFVAASSGTPSMLIPCIVFIVSFVFTTGSRLQSEQLTGWTQYELILPVSKVKIILAKYLSYLLLLLRGILSCLLLCAIMKLLNRPFALSHVVNSLMLSSAFALLVGAFIHPLHLLQKQADSSELLVRSLCISYIIFIFIAGSQQLSFPSIRLLDFRIAIPAFIAGVLFFFLSSIFSVLYYRWTER